MEYSAIAPPPPFDFIKVTDQNCKDLNDSIYGTHSLVPGIHAIRDSSTQLLNYTKSPEFGEKGQDQQS